MVRDKIIGRGTWIDKLTHEMILRENTLGRDTSMLNVESGLGASGIPHVGSVGDAVRAYGVKLALNNIGYDSKLIAYSDDMDGLRKIPLGFSKDLEEHLGKPVSFIPDPLGCHKSFGQHMSSLLLEGLDMLGIEYTFKSAKESYEKKLFTKQIHTILSNANLIGEKINELVGQEKFMQRLPYFAVCEKCDKIYTTTAKKYNPDKKMIEYSCLDAKAGDNIIHGCGHVGECSIENDLGKLSWKVEFAARWSAFDIRFEAYGKDIMDSVRVNDYISQGILNHAPPYHVRYEMFLDKGGKKISKSAGNVLTTQKWLQYGTPQSLLLLLYKRIKGARELGFEDIPSLMNEYDIIEDIYFGKIKLENQDKMISSRGLYEYINLAIPQKTSSIHINYNLLIELCRIFKEDRGRRVSEKLINYGIISKSTSEIEEKITLAGNFVDDFKELPSKEIQIDDSLRDALYKLVQILDKQGGDDLQNDIYQIAKSSNIPTREFFKILYQILLGTDRGPKIGPFIEDVGRNRSSQMIKKMI